MIVGGEDKNSKKRIQVFCLVSFISIPVPVCIGGFVAVITTYTHISLWIVLTIETLSGSDFNYDQLQMAEILMGIPIGGIAGAIFIAIVSYFIKVNKWPEMAVYLIFGMIFGGLGGLILGWGTLGFMTVGSS